MVPVSDVKLDQAELALEVTRTLEGDRRNPSESYSVTPSRRLYETVSPEYADNKEVTWTAGDTDMLRVEQDGMVSARADARLVADIIRTEEGNRENPYAVREVGGSRSSYLTVTTKDGGKQAVCAVNVSFHTVDNTVAHVERVALNQSEIKFMVEKLMTGSRTSPKVEYKVTQPQQLTAMVMPEEAQNKKVGWNLADSSMAALSEEGLVTVKRDAKWIQDLEAVEAAVPPAVEAAQAAAHQQAAPMNRGEKAVSGFIQDTVGWWYKNQDGTYPKSCWKQLSYNGTTEWYHFDEKGYMQTGWFTDTDGNIYYLHAIGDGTRGRMVTGWNLIDGNWYYFNTVSDGTRGELFINRETPDGYRVDAKGAWIP